MEGFDPRAPGRYESLFVGPSGQDVLLACPGRIQSETEKGRQDAGAGAVRATGWATESGRGRPLARRRLRGRGAAPGARARATPTLSAVSERLPEDEAAVLEAARLLADSVPQMQSMNVFAPLGLGTSADHRIAYEAAVRALATESGRNLFLYEERPEAFVPGAVRTRLALLGARLPPAAQKAAERSSLWRHLFSLLRAAPAAWGERAVRREHGGAGRGPPALPGGASLEPACAPSARGCSRSCTWRTSRRCASAPARSRSRCCRAMRPAGRGRPTASARVRRLPRRGSARVYHAERFWLFLPSGDGLPEIQHPMELAEA